MARRITPEQALKLCREEGYLHVDVRTVQEFEEGHPTGAYNVPFLTMGPMGPEANSDFVADIERLFPDPTTPLILGCRSGNRSLQAAEVLEQRGYTRVLDQKAGLEGARDPFGRMIEEGWRLKGLPVSTEADPGKSYAEIRAEK
jgi:rhodanese-related sulfurtransferase